MYMTTMLLLGSPRNPLTSHPYPIPHHPLSITITLPTAALTDVKRKDFLFLYLFVLYNYYTFDNNYKK